MEQQNSDHLIDLRSGKRKLMHFNLSPTAAELEQMSAYLDLVAIKKISFVGELQPKGKSDWRLVANLGASVVQSCRRTLQPVNARVDCTVTRSYLTSLIDMSFEAEMEMPEDDERDPLPDTLNLLDAAAEALSLELPPYPTHPDAENVDVVVAAAGIAPMTDEQAKPFAGLAALKDKLSSTDT